MFFSHAVGETTTTKSQKSSEMLKINSEGQYVSYSGYTVISLVKDYQRYLDIEDFIRSSPILSKYMTPLPASSYHVTIFDIFSQRNIPEKYKCTSGPVPSQCWIQVLENLRSDLSAIQKICSNVSEKISFQKIKFNLKMDPGRALGIGGALSNEYLASDIRKQCFLIFPLSRRPIMKYHLTLAYLYKKITVDNMEDIKKELDKLWYLIPLEQSLLQPGVFYFEKISEFTPLDKTGHE